MTATTARPHVDRHPGRWRGRPGRTTLLAAVVGAAAFDLAVQHPVGITTFVAVVLTVVALDVSVDVAQTPTARLLLGVSLLPAAMLVVRDSPWLMWPNLAASAGLILLAAIVRDEPRPLGRALGRMARPGTLLRPASAGLALLWEASTTTASSTEERRGRAGRALRSLAVTAPIVVVLVALLASADAVFASLFEVPFGPVGITEHGAAMLGGGALMTAAVAHRAWARPRPPLPVHHPLGPTEATVTLAAVFVVYGVFVATQVVAIAAGAGYVQRTTGLTYAEYAREGFFQLLAAALLTLVVVLGIARLSHATTDAARRRLLILAEGVVVLTIVVVGVAVRRLFLYESEFGLTMLRLTTIVVAVWIGIVFIAVGLFLAGRLRRELGLVVAGSALGVLLALSAVNPEAIVARRNIDRFGGTDRLDVAYLVTRLGADAMPTVLSDPAAAALLCVGAGDGPDDRALTFNLGRQRAASAIRDRCSPSI